MTCPDAADRPTITVAELAAILGVGERNLRDAIKRDEVPGVLRIGHRVVIATAAVRRWLHLDDPSPDEVRQNYERVLREAAAQEERRADFLRAAPNG